MKIYKAFDEKVVLEISLDQYIETDVDSLVKILILAENTKLHAIDVNYCHDATSSLTGDEVLKLLHAAGLKLRNVDLQHSCFGRQRERRCLCNATLDFRDLFHCGLQCRSLDLTYAHSHKLDIQGPFMFLHTLKLDFSYAISSFSDGCFSSMPKLVQLSLCGTSISNLWTTTAALSRLKMLSELRFQKCPCCCGTGHCPSRFISEVDSMCLQGNIVQQRQECDAFDLTTLSEDSFDSQDNGLRDVSSDGSLHLFSDDDLALTLTPIDIISEDSVGESDINSFVEVNREQQTGVAFDRQNVASCVDAKKDSSLETVHERPDDPTDKNELCTSKERLAPFNISSISSENSPEDDTEISVQSGIQFLDESDTTEVNADTFSLIRRVRQKISTQESLERADRGSPSEDALGNVDSGGFESAKEVQRQLVSTASASTSARPSRVASLCHSSPICLEKHYRHYMIVGLPNLKVLDNCEISQNEKEVAHRVYVDNFEFLPYNRREKENIVKAVERREIGGSASAHQVYKNRLGPMIDDRSSAGLCRSMCASMQASCAWPAMTPVCKFWKPNDHLRNFRPRQFEYHPTEASLMVIGTLHGEVIVVNHEADKLVGYADSFGAPHSILGLCWFNKDPNKLIAGSDNGSLQLFDVCHMRARMSSAEEQSLRRGSRGCKNPAVGNFENFDELTSVHINSTDDYFLASGYSKHVGLYDLHTGMKIQIFPDLHKQHINVVKFSNHSPHLFATSSFDKDIKLWDLRQKVSHPLYTVSSSIGNVMVCFSYDDHFLLSSAVDNEVQQHLAVDGRLHMKYDIAPTGSGQNYTRSYYMNGRDYIITGSCEENVVRIYCAQTGRRLKDLALEGRYNDSPYVQSLRGDLFQVVTRVSKHMIGVVS
ncbi:hypothetical protein O6H91_Y322100 [Diphasiastrum complanatum]|nr:hypothetical protein O6H91_Y322100 [Diphasiastrum complanatum]